MPGFQSSPQHVDPSVALARKIADGLDNYYIDPILGLILPGVGDIIGSLMGLSIVGIAAKRRVPKATMARMLLNLSADAALGSIPLIGDAFDVMFKANVANLALLERHTEAKKARWQDGLFLATAAIGFVVALSLPIALIVWALVALSHRVAG